MGNAPSKEFEMKTILILSLTFLVIATAARVSADPPLKANPNPIVVSAGQTQSNTSDELTINRRKVVFPFIVNVQLMPRASFVDISYSTPQPAPAPIELSTQRPLAAVADLPDVIPAGQKAPPAVPPDSALTHFAPS